ncbi:hypothetical protein AABB24_010868, partial [Solanum stoloniferum]
KPLIFFLSPSLLTKSAAQTPFSLIFVLHSGQCSLENEQRTTMESSGRRAKTTSEPQSLATALIGEQPGDQTVSVRQQQQHGNGATSCLSLRRKTSATSTPHSEQRW